MNKKTYFIIKDGDKNGEIYLVSSLQDVGYTKKFDGIFPIFSSEGIARQFSVEAATLNDFPDNPQFVSLSQDELLAIIPEIKNRHSKWFWLDATLPLTDESRLRGFSEIVALISKR